MGDLECWSGAQNRPGAPERSLKHDMFRAIQSAYVKMPRIAGALKKNEALERSQKTGLERLTQASNILRAQSVER